MSLADDERRVEQVYRAYFQALGSGDMNALAEKFTFPSVFKGFLDDVTIATDKASLLSTYRSLIAAAPKAAHSKLGNIEVASVRPGVYMLTVDYEQYGADQTLVYAGKAVYFMKRLNDDFRLFAVI